MSKTEMKGKTALITGAAKRIGRATALALADEGVNIAIHYNTSEGEAKNLALELESCGVKAWTIQADFDVQEQYETLIERTLELTGSLDILVNNASIFPFEKLEDVTLDSLIKNMEVNAWVPFVLSRSFKELVGKGKIINLEDSRTSGYDWSHIGYIMSKHVLAAFTRYTALAYAPDITVNAVAPGLILPPPGKDQSYLDRLVGTVPLKRHGEAEDIAEAVVFLAKSSFITGEVIHVDGGRHLKEYSNG
ncbi:MAG TPA: SDR family oxidoreductase [Armatimonadota bacterium]|nr:SDR family oxidoreductase [Armatimonadota bacterium]HPP73542.1 SDR family oxidoreductase [Armatimonadota bacterium]